MYQTEEQRVLKIPVSVFESAETKEELEDWLFAHDPEFIKEMERINKEFPSAAAVVQRQIGKSTKTQRSAWMPSRRDITHQEIEIIKS